MRCKAFLLLLFTLATGRRPSTCSLALEQDTQTVSLFQRTVVRKNLAQASKQAVRKQLHGGPSPGVDPQPLQNKSVPVADAYRSPSAGLNSESVHQRLQWPEEPKPKFPDGADIWNGSLIWANVTIRHPLGVIANSRTKQVVWADVSYLSLDSLYVVSLVTYPAVFIFGLLALTVLTGVCMAWERGGEPGAETETVMAEEAEDLGNRESIGPSLSLYTAGLSPRARQIFAAWSFFCRTIPAWMMFGTPAVLVALTYPYPQEVFMLLVVVSSVLVFSNGLYMAFFCPFLLVKMRKAMSGSRESEEKAEEAQIVHWVVLPNYQEDVEILSGSLESIAQSAIAAKQICVLLAMEEREHDAQHKADLLKAKFAGSFKEVAVTMHPSGLPHDPPGKASNMAWAFKWLTRHVQTTEQDPSLVILTVADADSDFHISYFQGLGQQFLETDPSRRSLRIWQAPVFHVKNYHRQPMVLVVGTIFTAMTEIATLGDPNSIRFPYSTYSLSLDLARRVGGWDAEWIAEDWHMGIKCFLLTLGETEVHPVLLPTVNYMPEDSTWLGTLSARWSQAKRHSLGFSDMSYYFMMLPLLYCHLSASHGKAGKPSLQDFWKTFFHGIAYIVRLVNVHVVVGIMTLYMLMSFALKHVMYFALQDLRHIGLLFDRAAAACGAFLGSSLVMIAIMTLSFQVVYSSLKDRMEPTTSGKHLFSFTVVHWAYTFVACILFAAVYCTGLAATVWIAAIKVLLSPTFVYEVAAKPTKDLRA